MPSGVSARLEQLDELQAGGLDLRALAAGEVAVEPGGPLDMDVLLPAPTWRGVGLCPTCGRGPGLVPAAQCEPAPPPTEETSRTRTNTGPPLAQDSVVRTEDQAPLVAPAAAPSACAYGAPICVMSVKRSPPKPQLRPDTVLTGEREIYRR